MRIIRFLLLLSLPMMHISCIEISKKGSELNSSMIQPVEEPRVIRDTIVREVVVLDTIYTKEEEVSPKSKVVAPAPKTSVSTSSRTYNERDGYDRSNSGFFDEYRNSYKGDPNKDLKPITKTVRSVSTEVIEAQKEELEKQIEQLEEANKKQKEHEKAINQNIKKYNEKVTKSVDEYNRQVDERNRQSSQRNTQQSSGKNTLDTDLLLNR